MQVGIFQLDARRAVESPNAEADDAHEIVLRFRCISL